MNSLCLASSCLRSEFKVRITSHSSARAFARGLRSARSSSERSSPEELSSPDEKLLEEEQLSEQELLADDEACELVDDEPKLGASSSRSPVGMHQ